MPQNMQKKPQVADLEVDEEQEQVETGFAESKVAEVEIDTMSEEHPRYLEALKHLQHGRSQKQIADRLVNSGMTRLQAARLAKRVTQENPHEKRTNAMILLGAGGFFGVVGILLIAGRLVGTGVLPIFAPAYAFLLISAWFTYKGVQAWRNVK